MSVLIPEVFKIVCGTPIATTNGGIVCDYVSLKNCHRVTIVCELLQAVSHATTLGLNEATAVDGTGAAAVTATMPIWKNADVSASDTLVKGTDAATVSASAGATNQQIILTFDPVKLSSGFDCIAATLSDSSQATNFCSVVYFLETRFPQQTPPSAIVD